MSTYEAMGAVSQSLQHLLRARLDIPSGLLDVTVKVGPPPEAEDTVDGPLVNLFLYRVCENAAMQSVPQRGTGDRTLQRAPLAVDLHYLLTTYGTNNNTQDDTLKDEIRAHHLLGSAMRVLHDHAILTPALEDKGGKQILEPLLASAAEHVKITLQPLSLEDLSKVWTALSLPYRASAAYEVTVVQIDSRLGAAGGPPVGPGPDDGRHVRAVAAGAPRITGLHAAARHDAFIRPGDTLVLDGEGLLGDLSQVDIAGIPALGQVTSARADRMTVVVPNDLRLQPGVVELRLSHGATFGSPPERRATATSNTVAFGVIPRVDGVTVSAGNVHVTGERLLAPGAECLTIVQGITVPRAAYAASSTAGELVFPRPAGIDPARPARVFVRTAGMQSIDIVEL